ncbi:hypothetical protein DFJ74DRAFT_703653 [Hyaloraphidium curvatum]|nr:hypothetical protein DFJ74DRAFT_703653 [Hyaloraphidium curvatum]
MEYESNAVRSLDELDLAVEDLRRDGYTAIRALTDAEELEDIRSKFWALDGICLIRPPEVVPEEAERIRKGTFRAWPHVDQHPLKRGLDTIQGLVTLYDSGPDDGGLVVYAKSHTDFASKFWLHTRMRLAMALPSVNDGIVRGHKKIKLCGPAGTLFLSETTGPCIST